MISAGVGEGENKRTRVSTRWRKKLGPKEVRVEETI